MAVTGSPKKRGPKSNPYRGFGLLGHGQLAKISRNQGFGLFGHPPCSRFYGFAQIDGSRLRSGLPAGKV